MINFTLEEKMELNKIANKYISITLSTIEELPIEVKNIIKLNFRNFQKEIESMSIGSNDTILKEEGIYNK